MMHKLFSNPCAVYEPSIPSIATIFTERESPKKDVWVRNKRKILVVDDEKFNCDIVYGFLMILGVKNRAEITEFAYNGEEALNLVTESIKNNDPYKYSLIMMDCNMPFMDGYIATKKISEMYSKSDILKSNQPQIMGVTGHIEQ